MSPFDAVPNEILEYVLGLLPPYRDLEACSLVCRRWERCCRSVLRRAEGDLARAVSDARIVWRRGVCESDSGPRPFRLARRFSHAACVLGGSMYAFGGRTANSTAFNDLWRFDLSERRWSRPTTTGAYPPPKAGATMVAHEGRLVLFGGWASPDGAASAEVHVYDPRDGRWTRAPTDEGPPPTAGHSAQVLGDEMVVFGGLHRPPARPGRASDSVWTLNLRDMTWRERPTAPPRPEARYGQSAVALRPGRLMILGGIRARAAHDDCWILNADADVWSWRRVRVENEGWAAADIWCNPACRVGDKVVMLGRRRAEGDRPAYPAPARALRSGRNAADPAPRRTPDRDDNVNGRRGPLPPRRPDPAEAGPSGSAGPEPASAPPDKNPKPTPSGTKIIRHPRDAYRMAAFSTDSHRAENRLFNQRRIAHYDRQLEKHRRPPAEDPPPAAPPPPKRPGPNRLVLHVLDISAALDDDDRPSASWTEPQRGETEGAPEEVILYSLVRGTGELIMFGGLYCDGVAHSCTLSNHFSNSLHFIKPPKDII